MRRAREEIIIKILETCLTTDANKAAIIYKNHFSHKTAAPYLDSLIKNGFVVMIEGPRNAFKTTNRGIKLLSELKEFHELLQTLL